MDWASAASLATALGTIVLAVATFAAVRSANRAARAAEQSLLVGLRPLLVPSRLQDDPQKVMFGEGKWMKVAGGCAAAEAENGVVYLVASIRNVGPGIAVVHGWRWYPDASPNLSMPSLDGFRMQNRDIYVPPGEEGFWQGAFRDPSDPQHAQAWDAVTSQSRVTVDLLYGDHEGGQRVITRFGLMPRGDGNGYLLSAARHWNVDRPNPRITDSAAAEANLATALSQHARPQQDARR